jgi:hypothetical protein
MGSPTAVDDVSGKGPLPHWREKNRAVAEAPDRQMARPRGSRLARASLRHRRQIPTLNVVPFRIASLEMLPDTEPLPHLICSRRIFGSGGGDEAGHHGDAR